MPKRENLPALFWSFLKFGCFTFGGGWSIVAQMNKKYVEERGEITGEELLDLTSVGRSLPGTMIGNVAMLFGYHMAGIPGGLVCLLGMILPPFVILGGITFFYALFRSNVWVAAAMSGVRSAVVPIIASAALGLSGSAFKFPPCLWVMLITLALYLFFEVNCMWLVVLGLICGLIISEYYERRGR